MADGGRPLRFRPHRLRPKQPACCRQAPRRQTRDLRTVEEVTSPGRSSDWHGVHRFDWWGRYLDSPPSVGPAGLDPGMYYEITLDGYGPGSDLRIHPLGESQPRLYSAPE